MLDPSVLADIRALDACGDGHVAADVVRIFLTDVSAQLSALREAVQAHDATSIRQIAHRLRGSALMVGASTLAVICAQIEEAGRTGALHDVRSQSRSCELELRRLRPALEREAQ
jgi:HPt (histidine-containing phosphotransfer) domain-containing protein